ncbi:MAG: AAA family ATPase [Pirellulaceae bacterium]|nr:AAA family ATPase [Pirellulaceae bacterium]
MYQAYWGLQQSPFAAAIARHRLERSPIHAEALARLAFLVENGSRLGLLFGPAGSGKSLVLRQFADLQARTAAQVAAIPATGRGQRELLLALAEQWGCNPADDDDVVLLWRHIGNRLGELALEKTAAIVALDDLDAAGAEGAAFVLRLIALSDARLTVVASARTGDRVHSRLLELADLRIDLALWTEDETRDYLSGTLAEAGRAQPAFEEGALQKLFELSGGAPRKVNQLAQLALIAGAVQNLIQIDEPTIMAVHEELATAR